MLSLTRTHLVTLATFVALAASGTPSRGEDMAVNLGPVGPHQPILASVGESRVVAFYMPDGPNCGLQAVVWQDESGDDATRLRVSLSPRQIVHIDNAGQKTLSLQCGERAEQLAVVDSRELITAATAE